MVNVAARCRLCDDPPPPPPCRLTASSDSAVRLRPESKNTNTLIHYTPHARHIMIIHIISYYIYNKLYALFYDEITDFYNTRLDKQLVSYNESHFTIFSVGKWIRRICK